MVTPGVLDEFAVPRGTEVALKIAGAGWVNEEYKGGFQRDDILERCTPFKIDPWLDLRFNFSPLFYTAFRNLIFIHAYLYYYTFLATNQWFL